MTDGEIVEALKQVSTASLCTELFKLGFRSVYLEAFVLDKVRAGAPLPGTYPPGPSTLAEYEASKRARNR